MKQNVSQRKSQNMIRSLIALGILLIMSLSAEARLHVGTKYLKLDQKPVGFIELWNSSDQTMYIQVDAFKYTVDQDGKVAEFRSRNPKALGLLYTPNKIVIKAGKKKRLRVTAFNKNLGNKHEYYKLTYNILNKPHDQIAREEGAMSASVRIGILYETLIDVGQAPLRYTTKTAAQKGDKQLRITNTGNALMSIGPFYQCKNENQCEGLYIYTSLIPGQSFNYSINQDLPTRYIKYDIGSYYGRKQRQATKKLT